MQTGSGLDQPVTGLDSRVIHLLSVCERLVGVRELVAQRVVSARVCFIWGSIIMSVRLYTCDYTKAVLSHFYFTSRQPKTKKQNVCNTKIGREISHSDVTLGLVRFQTTPKLVNAITQTCNNQAHSQSVSHAPVAPKGVTAL